MVQQIPIKSRRKGNKHITHIKHHKHILQIPLSQSDTQDFFMVKLQLSKSSPHLKMSKTSTELNPKHLLLTFTIMSPLFHLRPLWLFLLPFTSTNYLRRAPRSSYDVLWPHHFRPWAMHLCPATFSLGQKFRSRFYAMKPSISNLVKNLYCSCLVIFFFGSTIFNLLPLLQGPRRLRESEFAFTSCCLPLCLPSQACSIASVSAPSSASRCPKILVHRGPRARTRPPDLPFLPWRPTLSPASTHIPWWPPT